MKIYHHEIEYELYKTTPRQKLVLIQFKHRTLAINVVFQIGI